MEGIIPVNKPRGMTSHDVVFKLRKIFKTKKIGHTGTLDPEVDGVLPICVGKATRVADYVMNSGKTYIAEVTLGVQTTTEDAHGEVVQKVPILKDAFNEVTIDEVLMQLTGVIDQTPPMYSAVKVNGRKLYEYARNGETIERPSRKVEIYEIRRLSDVTFVDEVCKFKIEVSCGKGTYIRTLATQIADALGTIGHMSDLTRIASGGFKVEESYTLESLQNTEYEALAELLLPIEHGLQHLPRVEVDENIAQKILWGQKLKQMSPKIEEETAMFYNDKVLAIYMPDEKHPGLIKARKVFN